MFNERGKNTKSDIISVLNNQISLNFFTTIKQCAICFELFSENNLVEGGAPWIWLLMFSTSYARINKLRKLKCNMIDLARK